MMSFAEKKIGKMATKKTSTNDDLTRKNMGK